MKTEVYFLQVTIAINTIDSGQPTPESEKLFYDWLFNYDFGKFVLRNTQPGLWTKKLVFEHEGETTEFLTDCPLLFDTVKQNSERILQTVY